MPDAADDLLGVARLLADDPKRVTVEAAPVGDRTELRVRVAADDRGKLIGKRGRTIDALRALARVRSDREGRTYEVELLED